MHPHLLCRILLLVLLPLLGKVLRLLPDENVPMLLWCWHSYRGTALLQVPTLLLGYCTYLCDLLLCMRRRAGNTRGTEDLRWGN
jgi:hypothetical protein